MRPRCRMGSEPTTSSERSAHRPRRRWFGGRLGLALQFDRILGARSDRDDLTAEKAESAQGVGASEVIPTMPRRGLG